MNKCHIAHNGLGQEQPVLTPARVGESTQSVKGFLIPSLIHMPKESLYQTPYGSIFPPSWMALQAAIGNISDPLFSMVFFCLGFIMAFIAIDIRTRALMAGRALSICVPMIHGEVMPIHIDVMPVRWAMALRTLSSPVTRGGSVARLAVITHLVVIEISRFPGVRAVTGRTLPREVIGWAIIRMTALAIVSRLIVIEICGFPSVRAVTG